VGFILARLSQSLITECGKPAFCRMMEPIRRSRAGIKPPERFVHEGRAHPKQIRSPEGHGACRSSSLAVRLPDFLLRPTFGLVRSTASPFDRPISAHFYGVPSFFASAAIFVRRLERRSRQLRAGPVGKVRRNISSAWCAVCKESMIPLRPVRVVEGVFGGGNTCRGFKRAC
jgi:hypothetical protein